MTTNEYIQFFVSDDFFAAKGLTVAEIIIALPVMDSKMLPAGEAQLIYYPEVENRGADWGRFDVNAQTHLTSIVISEPINDWIYFKIHWGHFNGIKSVIEKLLLTDSVEVNYYYEDMCADSCMWVLAKNKKIYRAFEYGMGSIDQNDGEPIFEHERKFIKNIETNPYGNVEGPSLHEMLTYVIEQTGNHQLLTDTYTESPSTCVIGKYEIDLTNL